MQKRRFDPICLYAPSGSGKTALWATLAVWINRTFGKRTRVYNAAGGKETAMYLVDLGIADFWELRDTEHPFEKVRLGAEGYWPEDVTDPASPLMPPFLTKFTQACSKCAKVRYDGTEKPPAAICVSCKVNMEVKSLREPNPKNDLTQFGLVVFEGLTWFAEMFMDNMKQRSAKGERMGSEVAVKFTDGSMQIASATQNAYDIAQGRVKDAVEASWMLSCEYVLWTALEDKGQDKLTQTPTFGPAVIGHAATPKSPSWFGPTLSPRVVRKGADGREYRLYLTSFFTDEAPTIEHVVNNRIAPIALKDLPAYKVVDPNNPVFLGEVLADLEARRLRAAEISKQSINKKESVTV